MMNGEELVNLSLEIGQKMGAKFVEARYVDAGEITYVMRNGKFLSIQQKGSQGIGIRVLAGEGMGFGSTEILTREGIMETIERAVKLAKRVKNKHPIRLSEEKIEQAKWVTPVKQSFNVVSNEEKIEFLQNLEQNLKKDLGKSLKNRIFLLMGNIESKYLGTSEGTRIQSENSMPALFAINNAKGPLGSEQRMLFLGGTGGWEWFEQQQISARVLEDARGLVNSAQKAKPVRFDHPVDVIISSEVAGIMAHENVGHPSEADRIFGREGAQAGESFYADLLQNAKLGEIQLGSEEVNIIDDPTMLGNAGYYLYDDEGVKARPRYLIKQGRLNDLYLNREFAARMQLHSNAPARAITFDREPITRMANTYFGPGTFESVEELAEDIKDGIFMNSFTEWNIDDRRFQSKYVGLEAYRIQNGQITSEMVRRPVLELTTKGILSNIDGATKNYFAPYGTCGKSDPIQGVPVSMGGSELRLRGINVGGRE
jgi:TldD protein